MGLEIITVMRTFFRNNGLKMIAISVPWCTDSVAHPPPPPAPPLYTTYIPVLVAGLVPFTNLVSNSLRARMPD